MIEENNSHQHQQLQLQQNQEINQEANPEPILPKITKSQIVQTSSLQEITNKMISETSALVSFLSTLLERIQFHPTLTKKSINHLFQCLDFIPKTNFFYPFDALKQITELLGQLMKTVEQSLIDSKIKKTIFEKGYRINESLIDYRLKEKYLVFFYTPECNQNLSEAFYSDIQKLSKGNNCNIGAVNQLQLIFDNVNCKMSGKYRNDIGNQLYDLRVLARTNFRKFSYQPDANKKKQVIYVKSSGNKEDTPSSANINKNTTTTCTPGNNSNITTIGSKEILISEDIEIIQLFSQVEPKNMKKESFSFKHRYSNQVDNKENNDTSIDNLNPLESNASSTGNGMINNNREVSNFAAVTQEIITQNPSFNQALNSDMNENNNTKAESNIELNTMKSNEKEEVNKIANELDDKQCNTMNASQKQNQQTTLIPQSLTEQNKEEDKLKQKAIISPQRTQSEDKTHLNSNSNINFNINIPNINQVQGAFNSFESSNIHPNSNSKMNNKAPYNNNSNKNQQSQSQNYVNPMNLQMQMANFYQNIMSMNNQQQQNRNFFPQSNHQYNTNNNNSNNHISSEQLKAEYLSLKSLEHDSQSLVKTNLLKYEQFVIIPIYQQLNRMVNQKKHVYSDVFNKYKPIIISVLTKNQLEKSIVQPFGSIVNNFLLDEGDVDICIVPDNCSIENFSVHLNEINEIITSKHIGICLLSHISPRYSLLKINDIESGMIVDITVQSMLPLFNTKLIRAYSLYDQRFHILGIYIKYWVKRNKINGATEKYLSSYALIIMIIHFLQIESKPSVLPVLQRITNENKPYEYTHSEKVFVRNVYFEEDLNKIKKYMNIINCGQDNKESVASLLLKFFEFYTYNYDHTYLLSISNTEKIPASNEHIAFPINDPFDEEHNPGKSMKLNSSQYDSFIVCMKKEINHILRGDIVPNDFLLGY